MTKPPLLFGAQSHAVFISPKCLRLLAVPWLKGQRTFGWVEKHDKDWYLALSLRLFMPFAKVARRPFPAREFSRCYALWTMRFGHLPRMPFNSSFENCQNGLSLI